MGIPYVYKDTDRLNFPNGNLTWLKGSDDKLLVEFLYHTSQSPSRIERTPPKREATGSNPVWRATKPQKWGFFRPRRFLYLVRFC